MIYFHDVPAGAAHALKEDVGIRLYPESHRAYHLAPHQFKVSRSGISITAGSFSKHYPWGTLKYLEVIYALPA